MYQIERKSLKGLFNIAKEHVTLGIYAIEKNNIIDMKRDVVDSKTQLKEKIRQYKSQGYKVYSNGQGI